MSLAEVIADKGALGYFIQYLEARLAGALIRFYLDVECFRSAAHEDARASRAPERQTGVKHKNNSSSDCDSLHSPSFHNEIENAISVKAKENDSPVDNDVYESANAQSDAMRIFEKYLGLNAPLPVPIDEDIRNSAALTLCRQGFLDPECFSPAQNVCYDVMEDE